MRRKCQEKCSQVDNDAVNGNVDDEEEVGDAEQKKIETEAEQML